jgi:hypothetical protein
MRNPFRRRRRLPGAEADRDEDAHVAVGDDNVAIPAEQLPPEAVERLAGVKLYDLSQFTGEARASLPPDHRTGSGVCVNLDAVYAEIERWLRERAESAQSARSELEPPADSEMDSAIEAAFNNTDNWMAGGVEGMGDEPAAGEGDRYAVYRVNLTTGRIEFSARLRTDVFALMGEHLDV